MFSGSIPALVTPFRDGLIDEEAFAALVEWQIAEGSSALVPVGTTGESATLDMDEHHRVIALCVEVAAGRVPVIAGCGSNATATAIAHLERAAKSGADGALVVAPYYNRPGQAGILAHYTAVAEASRLPIVVYNVPARTVTDILPETMAAISRLPNVVAVKDASGALGRVTEHRLGCAAGFVQLSGNDDLALAFNAMGGEGCISVTANVAPRLCADFQRACLEARWNDALGLHDRLFLLHAALFSDASPAPTKYALGRVRPGFPEALRLPLVPASEASRARVDAALAHAGLV